MGDKGKSLTGGGPDPHLQVEKQVQRRKGPCSKPPGSPTELGPQPGSGAASPTPPEAGKRGSDLAFLPAFKFRVFLQAPRSQPQVYRLPGQPRVNAVRFAN